MILSDHIMMSSNKHISQQFSLRGLHFLPENNYDLVGTAHPTMCYAGVFVGWAVPTKKRINYKKSVRSVDEKTSPTMHHSSLPPLSDLKSQKY